jgi:hypothetical protein
MRPTIAHLVKGTQKEIDIGDVAILSQPFGQRLGSDFDGSNEQRPVCGPYLPQWGQ